ncbi:MAG: hypothetical protein QM759_08160 [Terricaulis sp.]
MADVLIVCVREDEPQAKALAEMFEAAGFSIGGAPSSDAALRSSGAGVVVWSQASIRSRPFLDAAQRVINANKAVVASLIEPPPPSSIGDAPAFDLSMWHGDPNDSSLDPLFFAVDRMVNSQRASVGAAQEEIEDEPPSMPRSMRRDPPAPPQSPVQRAASMFSNPPADPLRSETEHWRAIRDSRNPADFMDYLARFGPNGAFAEVAELRLKQLTERSAPQPSLRPAPLPTPPSQRPRTDARREPLPPLRQAPSAPPPRREPPPAMVRRETAPPPPPPRVNFDRPPPSYDRNDLRDPPKQEGGALRALVLLGILGAVALGGGLYFGGKLNLGGDDKAGGAQQQQQQAATDEPTTSDPMSTVPPAEQVGTPITAAASNPPSGPVASTPRRDAPQQQRNANVDTSGRDLNAAATPQQYASNTISPSPNSGGPISLTSPQSGNTSPLNGAAPIGPTVIPQSLPPSVATPTSTVVSRPPPAVRFTARPTARRIADLYPSRALNEGVGGRVELDCVVMSSLGLQCTVATELPSNVGFARAALSAAQSYRVSPTLSDGTAAIGTRTRVAVQFQAPN